MNFIVVGCGRIGSELAYRLYQKGHKVTVIDQIMSAFGNLPPDFLGRTVEGDALDSSVLHRAGIESTDGLAAVTSSDSLNAVVAHIARSFFNIPNVVVRNYNPAFRPVFEAFNLQIVSSSIWGAHRIEELLYHGEVRTIFSAGNGEVAVYEFSIPKHWHTRKVGDLLVDGECTPVGLTRAGFAMIPDCDTVLQESDILLVSATLNGIDAARMRIKSEEGAQ
jgi:trk system potassium uptake protein TrkA